MSSKTTTFVLVSAAPRSTNHQDPLSKPWGKSLPVLHALSQEGCHVHEAIDLGMVNGEEWILQEIKILIKYLYNLNQYLSIAILIFNWQ